MKTKDQSNGIERPIIEGANPVDENLEVFQQYPEYDEARGTLSESARTIW